jgi:hypothetical protein
VPKLYYYSRPTSGAQDLSLNENASFKDRLVGAFKSGLTSAGKQAYELGTSRYARDGASDFVSGEKGNAFNGLTYLAQINPLTGVPLGMLRAAKAALRGGLEGENIYQNRSWRQGWQNVDQGGAVNFNAMDGTPPGPDASQLDHMIYHQASIGQSSFLKGV